MARTRGSTRAVTNQIVTPPARTPLRAPPPPYPPPARPQDASRPCGLLALPLEIREMIWREYFDHEGGRQELDLLAYMRYGPVFRAIMQVCRQFQAEALAILIREHTLVKVHRRANISDLSRLSRPFREQVGRLFMQSCGTGHMYHEMLTLSDNFSRLKTLEVTEDRSTADSSLLVSVLADAMYHMCNQDHWGGGGLLAVDYQPLRWTSRAHYIDRRAILRAFGGAEARARSRSNIFPASLQTITIAFILKPTMVVNLRQQGFSTDYSWHDVGTANSVDNIPAMSYRHFINTPLDDD